MGDSILSSTIFVIAAILGCWQVESGVNPGIWESLKVKSWDYQYGTDGSNAGGYGLGQWTNYGTTHGRLYNLHNYLSNNGYADDSGPGEVAFFVSEGYWSGTSDKYGYTSLSDFLGSGETDVNNLVWDFLQCWEGVAGDKYATRCSYASAWVTYLTQHGTESADWSSTNGYLSTAQTRGNARLVYQILGGYIPESALYTITVTSSAGGTASADKTSAAAGEIVNLTATPDDGYYLSSWSGDVTIVNNTFTMPAHDVSVMAEFAAGEAPEPEPETDSYILPVAMLTRRHDLTGREVIVL